MKKITQVSTTPIEKTTILFFCIHKGSMICSSKYSVA
jgi:hypothetical protein